MNRIILSAAVAAFLCQTVAAQSSSSPYSMYGIGAIDTGNHGWSSGMSGLGTGLRETNTLNSANPAALTAIQEKTFILDMAVNGNMSYLSGQGRSALAGSGNIDRIGLGFRIGSFVSMSAGLTPLSSVEYSISKSSFKDGSSEKFDSRFTGSGGLHKIYLSLGFNVLRDLSVGISGSLIMGQITRTETSDYWSATTKSVSDITPYLNFGIQYHRQTGQYTSIAAGLTGGLKKEFSLHNTYSLTDNSDSTVVSDKVLASTEQAIPAYVGIGVSYTSMKWTVGADYTIQKYSGIDSGSDFLKYKDMAKLTVGIGYTPNKYDVRRYWKRIKFQFGAFIDDSYLTASGSSGWDWGISAGMMFPLRNSTSLYWSVNFKRLCFPISNRNTINESSIGLTLGISFGEKWFVRRKFE